MGTRTERVRPGVRSTRPLRCRASIMRWAEAARARRAEPESAFREVPLHNLLQLSDLLAGEHVEVALLFPL